VLNWLKGLFCNHKWKILSMRDLRIDGRMSGEVFTLQCEKCGDVIHKKLRVTV
jgi:hypothetical protein